jgi:2-dehydro-3-deoxygluconokinase
MTAVRLLAIGEVMAEIRVGAEGGFVLGFAGDTYNTAVYAAREMRQQGSVGYVTRVGREPLSTALVDQAKAEGLDVSHIAVDDERNIGIYAVATDAHGERSFSYWRSQSAARRLFAVEETALFMPHADIIYLSGITLAILTQAARSRLFDMLAGMRETNGTRVAFDSNFRPALWEDVATTRAAMERMWRITDIALPSIDDEMAISGLESETAVIDRFAGREWDGIAIKRGVRGPVSPHIVEADMPDFPPAETVVDTTAAGDSFNAGYLAAFLNGARDLDRMRAGHRLAARVVGAPGAIMPRDAG